MRNGTGASGGLETARSPDQATESSALLTEESLNGASLGAEPTGVEMDANRKEQISSLFLLLFSLFIGFASYKLSIGSITSPDAGFFPFYLSAILAGLSIRNFTKTIAKRQLAAEPSAPADCGINWKNIIVTVAVLFSYPLLLDSIGFALSTFLFAAFFLRCINPQRWPVVLGTAGAVAAVFYFVFRYWLKIQFPPGIFGV